MLENWIYVYNRKIYALISNRAFFYQRKNLAVTLKKNCIADACNLNRVYELLVLFVSFFAKKFNGRNFCSSFTRTLAHRHYRFFGGSGSSPLAFHSPMLYTAAVFFLVINVTMSYHIVTCCLIHLYPYNSSDGFLVVIGWFSTTLTRINQSQLRTRSNIRHSSECSLN